MPVVVIPLGATLVAGVRVRSQVEVEGDVVDVAGELVVDAGEVAAGAVSAADDLVGIG